MESDRSRRRRDLARVGRTRGRIDGCFHPTDFSGSVRTENFCIDLMIIDYAHSRRGGAWVVKAKKRFLREKNCAKRKLILCVEAFVACGLVLHAREK
jgi:hypothetical protein